MDKKKINTFAVKARKTLIESITLKLELLGINANGISDKLDTSTQEIEFYGSTGYQISGKDINRREALVNHLSYRNDNDNWQETLTDFIEEVAYTWFNRIIAIRFMEVNDYLPSKTRVLSSESNRNEPDILVNALDLEEELGGFSQAERELLNKARDLEQPEDLDKAYTMLFLKQVNILNDNLPELFEKTAFFLELLFTPNYHDGVIRDLIDSVDEADFDIANEGQVEIIGWLYQYYNQEPHDKVVNINGGAVKTNDIPAATQLFTTDWVVRYMVDNSLGKYYLERAQNSKIGDELQFLLPEELVHSDEILDVTKIKVIDNAMGSGHILVYAFDVLMKMYIEQGYSRREAATLILQNNIFGLEIDKRAYQLAYFALMMKAREYNRNALKQNINPNIHVYEETKDVPADYYDQIKADTATIEELKEIVALFSEARTLGSIIHFDKLFNYEKLHTALDTIPEDGLLDVFGTNELTQRLHRVLDVAAVMQAKYEIVVTNPPYLNKMNKVLKDYVKKYYKDYSGDLFSVFIWHNVNMTVENGYSAYMTPFVWMFIKTYEGLRKAILDSKQISSLIQMEYSAFEEATVPINTFVLKNTQDTANGVYIKLSDFKGGMEVQKEKVLEAIANPEIKYLYRTNQTNFEKIPGSPIAYWASENLLNDFERGERLDSIVDPKVGLQTGENNRFLRQWFEVKHQNIKFNAKDIPDSVASGLKWFPYNKGGSYRKWYGNNDYVVNWENDGFEIRNFKDAKGKLRSVTRNPSYYFREAITWPKITSGSFNARFRLSGSIHETAGNQAFLIDENKNIMKYLLGILNTKVANYIFNLLNPTINSQVGDFSNFPVLLKNTLIDNIEVTVNNNISISKTDWDSFETSWDFTTHPFMQHIDEHNRNGLVKDAYATWAQEAEERFNQLKANEEELNRIFIDLYGLQDELTPEVADKDVSVRRADEVRDVKSFLSYFVGCVLGRYSLDTPGLAYAGGEWDDSKYQTFVPNKDNMLVLTDDDYFKDERDIINRLQEFLTVTFGDENVDANMDYIAKVLGKKADSSAEAIRKYFISDFFAEHSKLYSKRPIYWEFSAGKNAGFRALMYVHRYDEDTMAMVRNAYVLPLQEAYQRVKDSMDALVDNETVAKVKKGYLNRIKVLEKQIDELRSYDPILQHIANEHIQIDLDDGVVVNYDKIQNGQKILTKVK